MAGVMKNDREYGQDPGTPHPPFTNSVTNEMHSNTRYIAVEPPPTPAPSPKPIVTHTFPFDNAPPAGSPLIRRQFLAAILDSCTQEELLFLSASIVPRLKRDFLGTLPTELALHILTFVDDPATLLRASQVSKYWHSLLQEETIWKRMCDVYGFDTEDAIMEASFSYRFHFRTWFLNMNHWRNGGHRIGEHRIPVVSPDNGVVTSVAIDHEWIVVGFANSKILIYSTTTGVLYKTLVGHELGVWSVHLVSKGGWRAPDPTPPSPPEEESTPSPLQTTRHKLARLSLDNAPLSEIEDLPASLGVAVGLDEEVTDEPPRPQAKRSSSDLCFSSQGWGQPSSLIVSGGCDKAVVVWDVLTGRKIHRMLGHTSTIRCIRVLQNRPIAISGSRDSTLRVWDIQKGNLLRVLSGHSASVRCMDACDNRVVSGSYDHTCRIWDVDTGECLHVLVGHFHQIYSVAFDGKYVASGGLDTTVRLWDAATGECTALMQAHTTLVCQVQLSPDLLITGGSDGRVITFSLETFSIAHRFAAHDSSVTSLQFVDDIGGNNNMQRLIVTSGGDGRVRLHDLKSGSYVRELSDGGENVWRVAVGWGICVIVFKKLGKTEVEIWSMRSQDGDRVDMKGKARSKDLVTETKRLTSPRTPTRLEAVLSSASGSSTPTQSSSNRGLHGQL